LDVALQRDDVASIIGRAQQGDALSRDVLARLVLRRLRPKVASLGVAVDDVDDVLHDIWLEFERTLPLLRDARALDGWLDRICVRRCSVHRARQEAVPTSLSLSDGELSREPCGSCAVSSLVSDRLAADAVFRAARSLPDQQRVAFGLRYLLDLTQPEIAEVMRCSESGVAASLTKARVRVAAAATR
jgi:RNA polymerase sigma factor (sigma-70 family)